MCSDTRTGEATRAPCPLRASPSGAFPMAFHGLSKSTRIGGSKFPHRPSTTFRTLGMRHQQFGELQSEHPCRASSDASSGVHVPGFRYSLKPAS